MYELKTLWPYLTEREKAYGPVIGSRGMRQELHKGNKVIPGISLNNKCNQKFSSDSLSIQLLGNSRYKVWSNSTVVHHLDLFEHCPRTLITAVNKHFLRKTYGKVWLIDLYYFLNLRFSWTSHHRIPPVFWKMRGHWGSLSNESFMIDKNQSC